MCIPLLCVWFSYTPNCHFKKLAQGYVMLEPIKPFDWKPFHICYANFWEKKLQHKCCMFSKCNGQNLWAESCQNTHCINKKNYKQNDVAKFLLRCLINISGPENYYYRVKLIQWPCSNSYLHEKDDFQFCFNYLKRYCSSHFYSFRSYKYKYTHTLHVQDSLVGVAVDGPLLLHLVLQFKDGLLQLLHLVLGLDPSLLQRSHLAAQLLLPPLRLLLNLLTLGLHLCMCVWRV